jgi:predicted RNase H-like HicB family nuclease
MKKTAEAYLERPYRRILIPDRETETYTAEVAEFPGCVAEGKTPAAALKRLEAAARSWIEAVLDTGQAVPEPMAEQAYSGRLILRLSRSLHRRAAEMAYTEGVSLNQFIATTLSERVGAVSVTTAAAKVGPSDEELRPAAIIPLLSLGISKVDKANNLTVDASAVNPARAPKRAVRPKASPKP